MSSNDTPRWRKVSTATPPHVFELRADWLVAEVGYYGNLPWLSPAGTSPVTLSDLCPTGRMCSLASRQRLAKRRSGTRIR